MSPLQQPGEINRQPAVEKGGGSAVVSSTVSNMEEQLQGAGSIKPGTLPTPMLRQLLFTAISIKNTIEDDSAHGAARTQRF